MADSQTYYAQNKEARLAYQHQYLEAKRDGTFVRNRHPRSDDERLELNRLRRLIERRQDINKPQLEIDQLIETKHKLLAREITVEQSEQLYPRSWRRDTAKERESRESIELAVAEVPSISPTQKKRSWSSRIDLIPPSHKQELSHQEKRTPHQTNSQEAELRQLREEVMNGIANTQYDYESIRRARIERAKLRGDAYRSYIRTQIINNRPSSDLN